MAKVVEEELKSLQDNSMWELVDLSPGHTTVKNR